MPLPMSRRSVVTAAAAIAGGDLKREMIRRISPFSSADLIFPGGPTAKRIQKIPRKVHVRARLGMSNCAFDVRSLVHFLHRETST